MFSHLVHFTGPLGEEVEAEVLVSNGNPMDELLFQVKSDLWTCSFAQSDVVRGCATICANLGFKSASSTDVLSVVLAIAEARDKFYESRVKV